MLYIYSLDKAEPAERRRRKATGLLQIAGLPGKQAVRFFYIYINFL
jgi:hypothetical protein